MKLAEACSRGRIPVRLWPGFTFPLDVRDPYDAMLFLGAYEAELVQLLAALLRAGDSFVDAGANIGFFTVLAAKLVAPGGEVLAFEPGDEAFARAKEAVQLNRRLAKLVRIRNVALLEQPGDALLSTRGVSGLESAISPQGNQRTRAVRLDDEMGVVSTGLVVAKVDVEGSEMRLFQGATRLLRSENVVIVCELNDEMLAKHGASVSSLVQMLVEAGFAAHTIGGRPLAWDASMPPWTNGVFVKGNEARRRAESAFQRAATS